MTVKAFLINLSNFQDRSIVTVTVYLTNPLSPSKEEGAIGGTEKLKARVCSPDANSLSLSKKNQLYTGHIINFINKFTHYQQTLKDTIYA